MDWLWSHLQTLFTQYPELLGVALGFVFAFGATWMFTALLLPDKLSASEKFRIQAVVDGLSTFAFTHALWRVFDPNEKIHGLATVISLGCGFVAPILHIGALKVIQRRWPWLEPTDHDAIIPDTDSHHA